MVKKHSLKIVHLYPEEMNIYGDNGNVLALKKRAEWRGIEVDVANIGIGESLPNDTDIIVSGGGQDLGQVKVADDLQIKQKQLKRMHDAGVVCLVVCGTYQLFGHYFQPQQGKKLPGIGIFDSYTIAKPPRLIGNIVINSEWGELVGYENHSGNTYLADGQLPLGKVLKGAGNNSEDAYEGAISNNFFGTYLHGPLLPKNPLLTDELLLRALRRHDSEVKLKELSDGIEIEAREIAKRRPR